MAVQTLTTVQLIERDSASDRLEVAPREDPDDKGSWMLTTHGTCSTVYATTDDLREFAHAPLGLVGEA